MIEERHQGYPYLTSGRRTGFACEVKGKPKWVYYTAEAEGIREDKRISCA